MPGDFPGPRQGRPAQRNVFVKTPTDDRVTDVDENPSRKTPLTATPNSPFAPGTLPTLPGQLELNDNIVAGQAGDVDAAIAANTELQRRADADGALVRVVPRPDPNQVTDTKPFRPEARPDFDRSIGDNVLNGYINTQYHVVLSMVPIASAVKIQQTVPREFGANKRQDNVDFLGQELEDIGAVVIASTGDTYQTDTSTFGFRDTLNEAQFSSVVDLGLIPESTLDSQITTDVSGRNYYNIRNLTLENWMSPSSSNPFISTILNAKMTLVEPHGFKLHEDIRSLSQQLGWTGINVGRIIYRMDIFFSGYDQDTGQWTSFIPMDTRVGKRTKVITYYFTMLDMQARVDHTGTTYDISLAPNGNMAFRPEEISVEAAAIFSGDQSKKETFGSFLLNLQKQMNKAVADRTENQVIRKYEFKAPPELLAASFFTGRFESKHGYLTNDPKGGLVVATGRDVNVLTVLEDALKDLNITWDNFLKKDDPDHKRPRVHWSMRFNVVYDSGPNFGLHDFTSITLQYIIEPYVSYKKATMTNAAEASRIVRQAAQVSRIQEMVELGMINRIYDYINTGENTEVIDIDINLKWFYFHTLWNQADNATSGAGNMQVESAHSKASNRKTQSLRVEREGVNAEGQESNPNDGIFGSTRTNGPACFVNQGDSPFDTFGGGLGEMPKSDFSGSIASSDQLDRQEYQANLDDHIRNDLLELENMQVRGDPIWLLSPYGSESGNVLATPNEAGATQGNDTGSSTAFVQTQSSRCILLRMKEPFQDDYMNPNRGDPRQSCNIIGGFYELTKVTSDFDGGKFTQTLEGYKLLHLNYVEGYIGLLRTGEIDTTTATRDSRVPQRAQQPNEALLQAVLRGENFLI